MRKWIEKLCIAIISALIGISITIYIAENREKVIASKIREHVIDSLNKTLETTNLIPRYTLEKTFSPLEESLEGYSVYDRLEKEYIINYVHVEPPVRVRNDSDKVQLVMGDHWVSAKYPLDVVSYRNLKSKVEAKKLLDTILKYKKH